MRTALVIVHAAPGLVGLLAGVFSLSPPRPGDGRRRWRQIYAICIATLIAGLVVLVGYDWGGLDPTTRVAFAGLAALAGVMGFRMWRASREVAEARDGWQQRYVGHIAFSYIALWVGFLIVPAINSPLPQVAVPAVVVCVLATGHVLVTRYRRRLGSSDDGRGETPAAAADQTPIDAIELDPP